VGGFIDLKKSKQAILYRGEHEEFCLMSDVFTDNVIAVITFYKEIGRRFIGGCRKITAKKL
jgi:hypothetical protein